MIAMLCVHTLHGLILLIFCHVVKLIMHEAVFVVSVVPPIFRCLLLY